MGTRESERDHLSVTLVPTFFTQPKVSDLHITICVEQQVVQLEVSREEWYNEAGISVSLYSSGV